MTTILSMKCKKGIMIAADKMVSGGNLKVHKSFSKITGVRGSNLLVGGAGSVASLQRILKMAIRGLQSNKIWGYNPDLTIVAGELADEIANINYLMPLEFELYRGTAYVIVDDEDIFIVDSDGSILQHDDYCSVGSGHQVALGLLTDAYKEGLTADETASILLHILETVNQNELFTGDNFDCFLVTSKKIISYCPKDEAKEVQKIISIKKNKVKPSEAVQQ